MREAISNLSSKKINQNNIQKQKSTLRCLIQNAGESVYGFWKPLRNPLPPKKHFLRPQTHLPCIKHPGIDFTKTKD